MADVLVSGKYLLYAFVSGLCIGYCGNDCKAADYQSSYLIKQPHQIVEMADVKQVTLDKLVGGKNESEKHT